MNNITDLQESIIRSKCRRQYIEEGNMDNPHAKGTMESLVWQAEESKIILESMESA